MLLKLYFYFFFIDFNLLIKTFFLMKICTKIDKKKWILNECSLVVKGIYNFD